MDNAAFDRQSKTGILIINLGTPDATDYWSMRRYLKQFLSDKRVIESKGPLWWLILNGIILTKRPKSSGRAYHKIWNHARDESPLRTITRAQCDRLSEAFNHRPDIIVDWAMRYGTPAIESKIQSLANQGCGRILIFPLYPQYSSATTGTAMDAVFDALKNMRAQPSLRVVPPYYDHPSYIKALAKSIDDFHATLSWKPDVTLASLHGLPQNFVDQGDPYESHCQATVNALRTTLGINKERLLMTYQSRTNRQVWLGPDTEAVLENLAADGVENLTILAPGFSSDCVETLEELNIRAVNTFKNAGGVNCAVIPCLNDSAPSIAMLKQLIEENLWADGARAP